jgi:pantoate kinase
VSNVRMTAAFAPGHVTGLFVPSLEARDPRGRGSLGAGIVLPLGVRASATWRVDVPRRIQIASDLGMPLPISEDVARRVVGSRRGALELFLSHELPVGCGFGMSAAGALATGLATAAAVGADRELAIQTAHLSDLFHGGGLGGVASILGGGTEIRTVPGIPPWGEIRHQAASSPIWIATLGPPLSSPPLLRSARFRERVARAGRPGLARLGNRPELLQLLAESEQFTDALGLAPKPLRRTLNSLRRSGARAAQAMLGRSLFAVAPRASARQRIVEILTAAGASALELRPPRSGARLRALRGG